MSFRNLAVAAVTVVPALYVSFSGVAHAGSDATLAGAGMSAPADEAGMLAYRHYVKEQADMLVGMTRVLAREIRDGNVEAAQAVYAPAHRYLARIEPVMHMMRDLHERMDAQADAYERKEADPRFAGFHRIEYGLFTNKSTAGLAGYADQLLKDSRALQGRVMLLGPSPGVLADSAARLVRDIGDERLAGGEERYSKTDLWDVEANIEGARQIVALLRGQGGVPTSKRLAAAAVHLAAIDAALQKHQDGCGFKSFDEISRDDRTALKIPVAALAGDLSSLSGTLAME